MLQICTVVGEIVNQKVEYQEDAADFTIKCHTFYATQQAVVERDAYIVVKPSKYVSQSVFATLSEGNLVLVQGTLEGTEMGNPFMDSEGKGVFTLEAGEIQKLAEVADDSRGSDFLQAIVLGNLGRDSEQRSTHSGKDLTTASMAVNTYVSKDVSRVIWLKLTAWIATVLDRMKKGQRALVIGIPTFDPETGGPNSWQTDGEARSGYEITVKRIIPLDKVQAAQPDAGAYEPDEIPF